MCFYDNYKFLCGDWKWGNFRMHCHAEYRIGETCGMKLVHNTHLLEDKCSICVQIERKLRRYEKTRSDYARWYKDPARRALAAKALEELGELAEEIKSLQATLEQKRQNIGSNRRAAPARVAA